MTDTRKDVASNLERAELPQQPVYLVSSQTMLAVVNKAVPKSEAIDEYQLFGDLEDQKARHFKFRSTN